jgi:hypothetical protein
MPEQPSPNQAVDDFIRRELDSVPHLEALLLLWNSRPKAWTASEIGAALFVNDTYSRDILQNLTRRYVASRTEHDLYAYNASPDRDALIAALDAEYRRNLIRITRLIHAKASPGVREFADAFRFKKDRET